MIDGANMRTLNLRSLLFLLFLFSFPTLCFSSETIVDADSQLTLEQSCVTKGQGDLKLRYPYISEEDAKYISVYGCSCAYKEAQQSSLAVVATDFRNARHCIYYAVLRNSMRYKVDSTKGENMNEPGIVKVCLSTFPRDLSDDSINEDISSFCNCASIPTEKIYDEIKPLKLNEDQIYEKLITVVNGCR